MNKILIAIVLLSLTGCSYKTVALKGTYPDGNFEGLSGNAKDKVWDNIIDFFARNGLSIKIIDRSSGLIISSPAKIPATFENTKGKLNNPSAWVVAAKTIDPANNRPFAVEVMGEWNIRIKDAPENKTLVNVNFILSTDRSLYDIKSGEKLLTKAQVRSTGIFEDMVFNKVK